MRVLFRTIRVGVPRTSAARKRPRAGNRRWCLQDTRVRRTCGLTCGLTPRRDGAPDSRRPPHRPSPLSSLQKLLRHCSEVTGWRLGRTRPCVIRLDAGYWGLKLIAWIHTTLGAAAVIPWNPKRQKRRDGLPPTWTAQELGKRTSIERFFGRVFVFFRLQRPPVFGWSAVETRVALTFAAVWVIALAAWQAGRPDLIRSQCLVLAHVWEGIDL